jgi:dTDP-4-dehydrorhamnose reductase
MDTQPDLWGGIECTVNRVGDHYFDQVERTGHSGRIEDLDQFANLGLKVLRYPIIWERCVSRTDGRPDWGWSDARLNRLRQLHIRPIAGLVHHGSGPRDTSLVDPAFPYELARFARAVAERYPWLDAYTPVNEPLTTARFSTLYGHWYPHSADDVRFARAIINQCKAVVLAMQEVRRVNPEARLVQTEDVGPTFSTPRLADQAAFQNERRWITYDLLTGRLAPGMVMWEWLLGVGIAEEELQWFREQPCPPDIVGINHYLTSDRFLDERLERYPGETPGSNGRDVYVDVAAVRVPGIRAPAVEESLRAAWERYERPLAITEVHNGGEVDEQMRWLHFVWTAACEARSAGIDIQAVTVWALLGLFDWHCLVTSQQGLYEQGVLDIRSGRPCMTPLARMVHDLAKSGMHRHPVLTSPGWWKRPDRFLWEPALDEYVPTG